MDKGGPPPPPPNLFVNDGSFMERFKQLQEVKEKEKSAETVAIGKDSNPKPVMLGSVTPKASVGGKVAMNLKGGDARKSSALQPGASGGKLAFSLKQKSKLVVPAVKLGSDEEDEDDGNAGTVRGDVSAKRQKLGQPDASEQRPLRLLDIAPPPPSDPTVKNVADKLAIFVAKNGQHFEDVTRQKNPGDTPFKFLFDKSSREFKYYEYRRSEEEKTYLLNGDSQIPSGGVTSTSTPKSSVASQKSHQQQPKYQIPASALYEASEDTRGSGYAVSAGRSGESSTYEGTDPIARMEFYMKKAAQEERRRQPKYSNDEMPPPASLQGGPPKKGHHMGDYIPQDELEKFLATCNDVAAQKAATEAAERAKIQADNVGHKLLSKMGWKEGEGLGSSKSGIADPIIAGNVKKDHLGVGAQQPGEVTPEDDIYEQYKKRMMLGYKHRPNPLNNPRKAYY